MIPNEAFEEGSGGRYKSLRVYHVNPPIPEPWRTREEYIQDRQAGERAEHRAIEAHEALLTELRRSRFQLWTAFALCALAAGALFVQTLQLRHELATRHQPTAVGTPPPSTTTPAAIQSNPPTANTQAAPALGQPDATGQQSATPAPKPAP